MLRVMQKRCVLQHTPDPAPDLVNQLRDFKAAYLDPTYAKAWGRLGKASHVGMSLAAAEKAAQLIVYHHRLSLRGRSVFQHGRRPLPAYLPMMKCPVRPRSG